MTATNQEPWRAELLNRFVRYVALHTTSDRNSQSIPSTARQMDFLRLLQAELQAAGVGSLELLDQGFLVARLAATPGREGAPVVGFMAHVDTASDVSGENVKPIVHANYDGKTIHLAQGEVLDPAIEPELLHYVGQTIITSDGTTLLGADDKAGVAILATALAYLSAGSDIPHGPLEFVFSTDEEIGRGMDRFPFDRLSMQVCYTLDGDGEGRIESECFNAWRVEAQFRGKVVHLGSARGGFANATAMAATLVSMLPRSESPEATDGRYGYFCPLSIEANLESAKVEIYLRDFDQDGIARRLNALRSFAAAVEAQFPGGKVQLTEEKQYLNLKTAMDKDPRVLEFLRTAVRQTGVEPVEGIIRGGTDGSRLSEAGIPAPNLFAGGHRFHSRTEWAALPAMERAFSVVLNLCRLWAPGK